MTREPTGSMIFHHPLEVGGDSSRGSALRPAQMLRAFEELGYEVVQVTGESSQRARSARHVKDEIAKGRRFDFVYGESATTPNALSDANHLPRHPFLDAGFFRSMRQAGVPVGVFYRDIYWRFDDYDTATTLPRRTVAKAFYHFDLEAYRRGVDVLFVPSQAMSARLPRRVHRTLRVVPLPPGGATSNELPSPGSADRSRLLYVGGVTPPVYALDRILDAVRGRDGLALTVCCRPEERGHLTDVPTNCRVVHEEGPGLRALYREADLALAVLGPHPNREFAIPIKVFEAVSHGVPVVVDRRTAIGDLVQQLGIGLTIGRDESLGGLLDELTQDLDRRTALASSVAAGRDLHSWTARARSVIDELTSGR